jgi:signal transduction histidine kinase
MIATALPSLPSAPSPPSPDLLSQFADTAATAVMSAEHRAQLKASRARIVAAADETRRRLQRDVHDGAQQRLVQTAITLQLTQRALAEGDAAAASRLAEESLAHVQRATADLRDLVRGILPAALVRGGLLAGVESFAAGLSIPVDVDIPPERLPPSVETTAYFIVAEALTNVAKHAQASATGVAAHVEQDVLVLRIQDDGAGGATADAGSGLTGLHDRVSAANGTLRVDSPRGRGTTVTAWLPLPAVTPTARAGAPDGGS